MGGSRSEEFLHPTPIGEDTFVRSAGGYAANVEAYRTQAPEARPIEGMPAAEIVDSPQTPTIATLVTLLNERHPRADRAWEAADTLKNVVLTPHNAGGVGGWHDVFERISGNVKLVEAGRRPRSWAARRSARGRLFRSPARDR